MANKIILKKSSVAAKVPLATDLEVGEIAVNLTDKKLYSKDAGGTVVELGNTGNVSGAASSTDNAIARFDGTTGKLIQNSGVVITDSGELVMNGATPIGGATVLAYKPTGDSYIITQAAALQSAGFEAYVDTEVIGFELNSSNGRLYAPSSLQFSTGGTTRATVNSAGLLVGYATAPSWGATYGLVGINGSGGSALSFGLAGTESAAVGFDSGQFFLDGYNDDVNVYAGSAKKVTFRVGGSTKALVNADGLLVGYSTTPTGWGGLGLVGINGTNGAGISLGDEGTEVGYLFADPTQAGLWASANLTVQSQAGFVRLMATGVNPVQFETGSTIRFTINSSGALGIGASPSYGTTGQVLTSQGSSSPPTWTTISGGASVTTDVTPPASPADGDLWWDAEAGALKVWYVDASGGQWVDASQGSIGPAATIAVGSTTTGAAGSSASVSNSGTSGAAVFNFTIPKGDKGDTGDTGPTGPMGPKSVAIQWPTTLDIKVVMFYTTSALTISKVISVLPGASSTPSLSFNVRHGADVSAAGTAVTLSAITTTSVSTGTATTSFFSTNANIAAGSFVWVEITAVAGTVPTASITLEF